MLNCMEVKWHICLVDGTHGIFKMLKSGVTACQLVLKQRNVGNANLRDWAYPQGPPILITKGILPDCTIRPAWWPSNYSKISYQPVQDSGDSNRNSTRSDETLDSSIRKCIDKNGSYPETDSLHGLCWRASFDTRIRRDENPYLGQPKEQSQELELGQNLPLEGEPILHQRFAEYHSFPQQIHQQQPLQSGNREQDNNCNPPPRHHVEC